MMGIIRWQKFYCTTQGKNVIGKIIFFLRKKVNKKIGFHLYAGKLGTSFPIWLPQFCIWLPQFCIHANWEPSSQFDCLRLAFVQIGNQIPNLRLYKLGKLQIGKKFPNLQKIKSFPICDGFPNLFLQIGHDFPNLQQIGKIWSPVYHPTMKKPGIILTKNLEKDGEQLSRRN